MDASESDLHWAAGYFDARGGYYFKSTQVTIILTDKDREVLERFRRIAGHGWIRRVEAKGTNVLQVSAKGDVRAVTEKFLPLVTRRKLADSMSAALRDSRLALVLRSALYSFS